MYVWMHAVISNNTITYIHAGVPTVDGILLDRHAVLAPFLPAQAAGALSVMNPLRAQCEFPVTTAGHYQVPSLSPKRSNHALRPPPAARSPCRFDTKIAH